MLELFENNIEETTEVNSEREHTVNDDSSLFSIDRNNNVSCVVKHRTEREEISDDVIRAKNMYQLGWIFLKRKKKMNGLQMHLQLTVQKKQPRFDRREGVEEKEEEDEKGTKEEGKKEQLIYLTCCFLFSLH